MVLGYRDGAAARTRAPTAAFEDVFRGPEERVRERQRVYLDLLARHEPVLDVGCGRGELLDLLRERGVAARESTPTPGMVERCRAKGHDVELADAQRAIWSSCRQEALGAVFSAQVIEHLPYAELTRFLELTLAAAARAACSSPRRSTRTRRMR